MNSLSFLSRQFDVLASTSAPNTPPSTPTGEQFPLIADCDDGSSLRPNQMPHPPLKRTRTWSARSFLIPAPEQVQQQQYQQRGSPPPIRARKRSGSTPNISRFPHDMRRGNGDRTEASGSAVSDATSAPMAEPAFDRSQEVPATMSPPIQAKLSSSEPGWVRRVYALRVLTLLLQWLWGVWGGLVRAVRSALTRNSVITFEATSETSEESENESTSSNGVVKRPAMLLKRPSTVRRRTSSIVATVLPPLTKPPTPSPLSKSINSPPPTFNVIPPESSESESEQPLSSISSSAFPTSSASLQPTSRASSPASSSPPAQATKTTPLHTRKTLVLDLDETLIHSTTRPLNSATGGSGILGIGGLIGFGHNRKSGHMVEVVMGDRSTLYHVYKRPFVDYFLRKVSSWYTLVIFTASMKEYADPVIDWLDAGRGVLTLRFFREHCTQLDNGSYAKDLSVLNEDLSRICLVDNSPISYSVNPANGIPIEGWTHDPSDEALLDLLPVLDSLRFTSDVRHVLGLRGF